MSLLTTFITVNNFGIAGLSHNIYSSLKSNPKLVQIPDTLGRTYVDVWQHIWPEAPAFNFINILRTVFMRADHKIVKKTVKLSIFFKLLGSTSVKASCKTLVKLTPGVSKFLLRWDCCWCPNHRIEQKAMFVPLC